MMDERDALARLISSPQAWREENTIVLAHERKLALDRADAAIAGGYRRIPEPGSAEWEAMVERAITGYADAIPRGEWLDGGAMDAALRAALYPDAPMKGDE